MQAKLNLSESMQSAIFDRTPAVRVGAGAPRAARRLVSALDAATATDCGVSVLGRTRDRAFEIVFSLKPQHIIDREAFMSSVVNAVIARCAPSMRSVTADRSSPGRDVNVKHSLSVFVTPPTSGQRPIAFGPVDSALQLRIVICPNTDQFVVVDDETHFFS